ncbi:hypothetical protein UY3_06014 [Chelonia mydas]|uniref:Uncharacterized protein n=1 Tax=Chelonia mydas TaxID=8469 RepID=M7BXM9_CHEMY|nr:hypothetical protein UY3_06014 [Chelonia mydas]
MVVNLMQKLIMRDKGQNSETKKKKYHWFDNNGCQKQLANHETMHGQKVDCHRKQGDEEEMLSELLNSIVEEKP